MTALLQRVVPVPAPVADGEEKFICQQWAWTGALDRYAAPPAYRPDGRWDGNDPL